MYKNESVGFLAQVGFAPPGHAKGLSCFWRLRNSPPSALTRQDGLRHPRRPNAFAFGFPKILKLLWLKPPFAAETAQIHFVIFKTSLLIFSGSWLGYFREI
ncbi:MAG: hypothetical protein DRP74_05045 [Candidatus Omnitrophota bacterium]|nr:MAG: hypothetical protein DRP74_05045 [Candidatus Omnitrophota bacterium]